jgi:hypothetical protein
VGQTSKTGDSLRGTNELQAMLVADDYERLASLLRYTPCLLETVAAGNPELSGSLNSAYRTAQATLLASSSILRALFRKQMIIRGDEIDNEDALKELSSDADLLYIDDDLNEPDWHDIEQAHPALRSPEDSDRFFLSDPRFCAVCFRAAGSRKFCSLHINTRGKSRNEIKGAQQFLPQYRSALITLLKKHRKFNGTSPPSHSDESLASDPNAISIEGVQSQTQTLLAMLLKHALWGLDTDKNPQARKQIEDAVESINTKIANVTATPPVVWAASASAVADLEALRLEIHTLCSKVDLLIDPGESNVLKEGLLGHELRLFSSAYTVDILLSIAAMCVNSRAPSQLPEDIRRNFYTQWLRGYQPQFSVGHRPITQARDTDFIEAQFDRDPFSTDRLWEHFARIAAWRKAEYLPPTRKQRLRRLSRDAVTALRETGASVEEIAEIMETTADGVRAAIARWDKNPLND